MSLDLESITTSIEEAETFRYVGRVTRVVGMLVEGVLPCARIGATCRIEPPGASAVLAEVVGLKEDRVILMPLGNRQGLSVGTRITMTAADATIAVGRSCLGRVLNGMGEPIDGAGPLRDTRPVPLIAPPINPLKRRGIEKTIDLGVKAINGLLTLGEGQRVAVLAGTGVGKSTLMGMIARNSDADVAVVALIGERGREVQEFVDEELRVAGVDTSRVVVVAATSDESPALRLRAAYTATAIAEFFRDCGDRVLLLMDSLTRVVMAQREIGLSVGEPPATRGYPPSAFAVIPQLLERTGLNDRGSITAIYTALIETEDFDDPVADAVRGTTDGHIVLSRRLAEAGQYPAIDVSRSLSRLMNHLVDTEHQRLARRFRTLLTNYEAADELISLGAYRQGTNPTYDQALERIGSLRAFLSQSPEQAISLEETLTELRASLEAPSLDSPRAANPFRRELSGAYARNQEILSTPAGESR